MYAKNNNYPGSLFIFCPKIFLTLNFFTSNIKYLEGVQNLFIYSKYIAIVDCQVNQSLMKQMSMSISNISFLVYVSKESDR